MDISTIHSIKKIINKISICNVVNGKKQFIYFEPTAIHRQGRLRQIKKEKKFIRDTKSASLVSDNILWIADLKTLIAK